MSQMLITFCNNKDESILEVKDTMIFEELFEEKLRLGLEEKRTILNHAYAVWMFVNGKLVGETFGAHPKDLYRFAGDSIEDTDPDDDANIYCYTTNILKPFQGRYLAPLLMVHFQGFLVAALRPRCIFESIIGHTTTPRMKALRQMFGANFTGSTHENWCGSERTAEYYEQRL
jgi:hypothetical protein